MPAGKVKVNRNKVPRLRAKWRAGKMAALHNLALTGRETCKQIIESGSSGITSDTGAIEASFYMESPIAQSGYDQSVTEMLDAYIARYPTQHGMARIASPPGELTANQSAFGTSSLVMAFWEYGHQNVFTGSFEKAPILRPAREVVRAKAGRAFYGLLRKKR